MASVEKRGKHSYRIEIYLGTDGYGERKKERHTWKAPEYMNDEESYAAAKAFAIELEERVRHAGVRDGHIKFGEFFEKWLEMREANIKANTHENYKAKGKRIIKAFGNLYLDEIKPMDIDSFINNLSNCDMRDDSRYKLKIDLRNALDNNEISIDQLAKESNVGKRTIIGCCNGKNISSNSANAISQALGVKVSELFIEIPLANGKLTGASKKYYFAVLGKAFDYAYKHHYIAENPVRSCEPPKYSRPKQATLSSLDVSKVLDCLKNESPMIHTAIFLLLSTGMCRGEVLGLQWHDIDFAGKSILVNKTWLYVRNHGCGESETKNDFSVRTIDFSDVTNDLLLCFREMQKRELADKGLVQDKNTYLFTLNGKQPVHPDTLSGWFKDFVRKYNLPDVHLHTLRHTNAALLISSETDIETISRRLGHSQVSTTLDIYGYSLSEKNREAGRKIDNILSSIKELAADTGDEESEKDEKYSVEFAELTYDEIKKKIFG